MEPQRERDAAGRPQSTRPRDRFGRPLPRGAVDELAHRREPEEVVGSLEEAFEEAVRLFDAERFFEAHEFVEYIWKSDAVAPQDRAFWKGVTQVAVGCVHTQRGNTTGAVTLLERAAGHLDGYPSPYRGVDTRRLQDAARTLAARIREEGPSPELELPRFPRGRPGGAGNLQE